jgi:hypothetical protein
LAIEQIGTFNAVCKSIKATILTQENWNLQIKEAALIYKCCSCFLNMDKDLVKDFLKDKISPLVKQDLIPILETVFLEFKKGRVITWDPTGEQITRIPPAKRRFRVHSSSTTKSLLVQISLRTICSRNKTISLEYSKVEGYPINKILQEPEVANELIKSYKINQQEKQPLFFHMVIENEEPSMDEAFLTGHAGYLKADRFLDFDERVRIDTALSSLL